MKAAVIVFPGSNCDRDIAVALKGAGADVDMVWHRETALEGYDLIAVPGGFSYGDYLRCGAVAARSPIMAAVTDQAKRGVSVLGVCNGFQVLTEAGLLPGVLMNNRDGRFICKDVPLRVEKADSRFTVHYQAGSVAITPVAHHDGNFFADEETLKAIEGNGQVVFRYAEADGSVTDDSNINGSLNNIAGIVSLEGNVLGMMPHPERAADAQFGGADGAPLFTSLMEALG